MEDERSQKIRNAFDALTSAQQSTLPTTETPPLNDTADNVWGDPYRPPQSTAPTLGLTPYNDAMPSPRYRSSHHPHRSTRVMGITEMPRIEQPPNPPPLPPWTREPDTESQTETIIGEGGGGGAGNRLTRIFGGRLTFWQRLQGKGKRQIGWGESFKNMATFSWLNVLLIFVPIALGVEQSQAARTVKFMFSFLAIIPLSKLLDYGGEQLAMYSGKTIGDLIVITLNNMVETILAIVLLIKCEIDLLQSSVAGVVLLRLLLVPGASFSLGGAHVLSQELHPHVSQLNNTLLILGVLALTLPTSFFSSLDRIFGESTQRAEADVTDGIRDNILAISRGLATLLVVIYVCSRIYLHNPPGEIDALSEHPDAPGAFKDEIEKVEKEEPVVNPWVLLISLLIAVLFLAFMAEHLVSNIRGVEESFHLKHEFFGLILLPFVSYSADGILSVVHYVGDLFRRDSKSKSGVSSTLAEGRSLDLAIQFLTFWLPFIVIVAWWAGKPMSLLFNMFEVVALVGACFLVAGVTVNAKTNWVTGFMMVVFYVMIVVVAWFYPGQADVRVLHSCLSVQEALRQEHRVFTLVKAAKNNTLIVQQPLNTSRTLPTAEAVDALNQRLQQILELHHIIPTATET